MSAKMYEQAPKNASGKTSVSVTASKLPMKAKVAPLGKRQAILLACVCVVAAACLTALSDLDKLGVSYIVTNEKPALSEEEMARLTTISVCGDYTIYKLESQ